MSYNSPASNLAFMKLIMFSVCVDSPLQPFWRLRILLFCPLHVNENRLHIRNTSQYNVVQININTKQYKK